MVLVLGKRRIAAILMFFLIIVGVTSIDMGKSVATFFSVAEDTKKTIIIDAGHGGEDPGAVSEYSGIKEKDVNLSIAINVKELLEKDNFNVIMTRSEDTLVHEPDTKGITKKRKQDLQRRKKIMDEGGADIVVSIHLNKFPKKEYWGFQTFFPPNSLESEKLAKSIQKQLIESVDKTNKREALIKKEPIIILKESKTPTVIVECGFLSNQDEEKKLADKSYQESLAKGIKDGISSYFKEPKK